MLRASNMCRQTLSPYGSFGRLFDPRVRLLKPAQIAGKRAFLVAMAR
jgi:hypothetical protein